MPTFKSYYPRLYRRNHIFYIRIAIPRDLWYISHKKEIRYSLHTANYVDALFDLRIEELKIDFFIQTLKDIHMRKQNDKLLLEPEDIDKFLLFRYKQIENFCDKNKFQLLHQMLSADDITLFNKKAFDEWYNKLYPPSAPDAFENPSKESCDWRFTLEVIRNQVIDFLKDLKNKKDISDNVSALIDEVLDNKLDPLPVLFHSPIKEVSPQLPKAYSELMGLDKYAEKLVEATAKGQEINVPKKYQHFFLAMNEEKAQLLAEVPSTKTKWADVAVKWLKEKQLKKTKKTATLKAYAGYLSIIFNFLQKTYVEDIVRTDIKKISYDIHKFPKNISQQLKAGKHIQDVLVEKNSPNAMNKKTIQQYLIAFKNFMHFLKAEGYIRDSYAENIVIPTVNRAKPNGEAFTEDDLLKIFDPRWYPLENDTKEYAKYWIPLLELYIGTRIGEICQLDVADVVLDAKVPYIKFYGDGDKSVKTTASWREVPVHPDLIELGFLDFVKKQVKKGYVKLFPTLKRDKNNHNGYANAIGKWLNEQYFRWIGIKTLSKTTHSFRYVVKQTLRPYRIPKEILNAILGWERADIGDSVYGGIVPAAELYEDYKKLQYPFLKKQLLALKKRTGTHYIMNKRRIQKILQEESKI